MAVIERLPLHQFRFQINIVLIGEQLVELLLVSAVRPFNLLIQPGCSWFDSIPRSSTCQRNFALKLNVISLSKRDSP